MGVETELLGVKNRWDGKEFQVIERENGDIAVLAGGVVVTDTNKVPVIASVSDQGTASQTAVLTQAQYDALTVKDPTTIYVIVG